MLHIVCPISLEEPFFIRIRTACAIDTFTYSSHCDSRSCTGTFALLYWFVAIGDGPMACRQHKQRLLQLKHSLLKQLRGSCMLNPSMLQQQQQLRIYATAWKLLLAG